MNRCQHCPSDKIRPIHFQPVDFALILVGVRRYRCEFCHEVQSRWLLPWPLRWPVGLTLIAVLYVASLGPAAWLWENAARDARDKELLEQMFRPLNKLVGHENADIDSPWPVRMLREYRDSWAPLAFRDAKKASGAKSGQSGTNTDGDYKTARPITNFDEPLIPPLAPSPTAEGSTDGRR